MVRKVFPEEVTWGGGEMVRSRLCEGAGHLLGNDRIVWSPRGVREQWVTPQTLRTIFGVESRALGSLGVV